MHLGKHGNATVSSGPIPDPTTVTEGQPEDSGSVMFSQGLGVIEAIEEGQALPNADTHH